MNYSYRWEVGSCKSQIINISGFAGQTVSVAALHLCLCSAEAVTGNKWANGHACVPVTLCRNRCWARSGLQAAVCPTPAVGHQVWAWDCLSCYCFPCGLLRAPLSGPTLQEVHSLRNTYHWISMNSTPPLENKNSEYSSRWAGKDRRPWGTAWDLAANQDLTTMSSTQPVTLFIFYFCNLMEVLGIQPWASRMLSIHSTTALYPPP